MLRVYKKYKDRIGIPVGRRLAVKRSAARSGRRGIAYILAMLLLVIFSSLAVAFASFSNLNFRQSDNHRAILRARLAAESGLEYMSDVIRQARLPGGTNQNTLLSRLNDYLGGTLNGTANIGQQQVIYGGGVITVPTIAVHDGSSGFTTSITLDGEGLVNLNVVGSCDGVSRSVGMKFDMLPGSSPIFDYGIASKSKIRMTGNAHVEGANNPAEAQMYSGTYSDQEAMKFTGNCEVDGDVFAANSDAYVTLRGNVEIGGVNNWDDEIEDHIHVGIGDVEFPEPDPTVFEPYATNIVDASTNTGGNKTFQNIRIEANSNKTFSGNITLKGVIYVEQPNTVHFSGNVNLIGVIVTEDAGEDNYDSNTIKFTGNTNVQGVENLPDTPEFSELRQMPGAFILAPGFGVHFAGNFGTVSGCMAADEYKFAGNAGGLVRGSIINYSDSEFKLVGNSHITIDRDGMPDTPPGFAMPMILVSLPGSYYEQ